MSVWWQVARLQPHRIWLLCYAGEKHNVPASEPVPTRQVAMHPSKNRIMASGILKGARVYVSDRWSLIYWYCAIGFTGIILLHRGVH